MSLILLSTSRIFSIFSIPYSVAAIFHMYMYDTLIGMYTLVHMVTTGLLDQYHNYRLIYAATIVHYWFDAFPYFSFTVITFLFCFSDCSNSTFYHGTLVVLIYRRSVTDHWVSLSLPGPRAAFHWLPILGHLEAAAIGGWWGRCSLPGTREAPRRQSLVRPCLGTSLLASNHVDKVSSCLRLSLRCGHMGWTRRWCHEAERRYAPWGGWRRFIWEHQNTQPCLFHSAACWFRPQLTLLAY